MSKSLLLPAISHKDYRLGQLPGASLALLLAEYCQSQSGLILIVCQDSLAVDQLESELRFFLGESEKPILAFPDWETLPYDQFSPHQDLISERLQTLSRLQQNQNAILLSSVNTLMHRLCPTDYIRQQSFVLAKGDTIEIDAFRRQLQAAGYFAVNKVLEHGEYAVRGSIIDVFPMGLNLPFRIELFDDEIESLRYFDPENQRSQEKVESIRILPAREVPLNEAGIAQFRRQFREQFTGNPSLCPLYESISAGQFPSGIEYYLPLFFNETASLIDYLPSNSQIVQIESLIEPAERFWQEVKQRYDQRAYDISRPLLKPEQICLPPEEFLGQVKALRRLRLKSAPIEQAKGQNLAVEAGKAYPINRGNEAKPLEKLVAAIENTDYCTLLAVESAGRREVVLDLIKQTKPELVSAIRIQDSFQSFLDNKAKINLVIAPLQAGASVQEAKLNIIVEQQYLGEQAVRQRSPQQKTVDPDRIIRDLAELQIGAPVVHIQFGIGRYQGLQTMQNQGQENEFLVLSYAGNDKIYVPVTALNDISRYTGQDSDHAPLHRLGSDLWQREKKKAAEKIHDVAIELLEIYAKREAKPGYKYHFDKAEYQRFAALFPFVETEDQIRCIEQIIQDLAKERPMDRLICGDVGFGKTEVAMRAAFIAAQNSKQVCVLAPTTLLAGQHYSSFKDRFAEFPMHIELLSRFRSAKESEKVLQGLKEGKIDIVIGTHKLFQKNVAFHNLGLMIIDEEHRFGVKQKEQIKALRTDVDVLSMTATPIPRTLNMAMANIRDISLIATPPAKRLAIKTFWQERNDSLLREAILREILRGGQVFFLHNNVDTMNNMVNELRALVPEAKIDFAHGQMPERQLERIMADFYHHRFNLLVCTTIIETGIDIPTANTIIIDRADKFGLAQLHQLRGRVGRSHHQAYAYLLTPNQKLLTPDAIKRLEALVSLEDLGAGFALATHDLEIRGAGELLGEEQSGNMMAIGFNLYMEMLDKAVNDLKSGKVPELNAPMQQGPEIELRISALIPEDYVADIHTRLILYKRIANAKTKEALRELQVELIDRFGLLPQPAKQLFLVSELKIQAAEIGVQRIQANAEQGKIEFQQQAKIDPRVLIRLIQQEAQQYQLEGPTKLKFRIQHKDTEQRIWEIAELLQKLRLKEV